MEYIIDKDGKWLVDGNALMLIEPSENFIIESEKEDLIREKEKLAELELQKSIPTTEDYLLDYEFRLSMIELGL